MRRLIHSAGLMLVAGLVLVSQLCPVGRAGAEIAASVYQSPLTKKHLPPPTGPLKPKRKTTLGDDGIYRYDWYEESFLDMRDEWQAARDEGKNLVVFVEQRGCSYCKFIQTEVMGLPYINDYVHKNFRVVQINLWGERLATDFDGKQMPEKELARRWSVMFTPTTILYDMTRARDGKPGRAWEVTRMPGAFKRNTFYDMFVWVRSGAYQDVIDFQTFHIDRIKARKKYESLLKESGLKASGLKASGKS